MIDVLILIAPYEIIPGEVTQAIDITHRLHIVVSETLSTTTTTLQSEPRAYSGMCYGNAIRFTHLYSLYSEIKENQMAINKVKELEIRQGNYIDGVLYHITGFPTRYSVTYNSPSPAYGKISGGKTTVAKYRKYISTKTFKEDLPK